MGEPANRDFVIPDEPTRGDIPTNYLLIALPRDEDDNRPRAYTIESVIGLLTGGLIKNRLAALTGDDRLSYDDLKGQPTAPNSLTVEQVVDAMSEVAGLMTGELMKLGVRANETEPWATLEQNVRYEPVNYSSLSGRLEFYFRTFDGNHYFNFNSGEGTPIGIFLRDLHAPAVVAVLNLNDFTEYFRGTITGNYVAGRGVPIDLPDGWESTITAEAEYHVGVSQAIPPEDVVSIGEIRDEIDVQVLPFARSIAAIPAQDKLLEMPIAWQGSVQATAEDTSMTDGEFRIQEVSGQDYLKIYGLSAHEEAYLRSWQPGTLVGFYDNFDNVRDTLAIVDGEYDETNGLPLDTDTLDSTFDTAIGYSVNAEYTIYSTQPQPIRLVNRLPAINDALQNVIYAILEDNDSIKGDKGYIRGVRDVTAFFSFSASNLANNHVGYSTVAITDYGLPSNTNSQRVTGVDAITEQFTAGQGIQWLFVFPLATTLVDDDDTQLFMYRESGGEPIVLHRDASITTRVVFASVYDGADARTITGGNTVTLGVWKEDNTALIETSITAETSYLEFDLRPAVGF